jgi:hypothetical protein
MKLYFDHVLGNQKNKDFVFSLVSATFEKSEWDWAFETGWAPTVVWFETNFSNSEPLIWYQCRQSRIKLSEYKPNPKTKKLVNNTEVKFIITNSLDIPIEDINEVYLRYCEHKNFGDILPFNEVKALLLHEKSDKNYYIQFFIEDKLIAITKLSLWGTSLISEIFWWNYQSPELSLGKISFYLEIELAKKLELQYLYTGISYNSDSIYKSQKKGFQFWTGRDWSSDSTIFEGLCLADDTIETIEELHEYQYSYLKKLEI